MYIKNNSTVCCLGDGITEQGYWIHDMMNYFAAVEPDDKIKLYNCGIAGTTAEMAAYYFADEIMWAKPDYVLIGFGANDIGLKLYGNDTNEEILKKREHCMNKYKKYLRIVAELIENLGIKVIFTMGYISDIHKENGAYSQIKTAYDEICEYNRELAKKFDSDGNNIIDIYDELWKEYERLNAEGKDFFQPDGIHPSRIGHAVIASATLKALGYTKNISVDDMLERTPLNADRFDDERHLRNISFVKWGMFHPLSKNGSEVDFKALDRIYETAEQGMKCRISDCRRLHDKVNVLRKILVSKTEKLVSAFEPSDEDKKIMSHYAKIILNEK